MKINIHELAAKEFDEAIEWYEIQAKGHKIILPHQPEPCLLYQPDGGRNRPAASLDDPQSRQRAVQHSGAPCCRQRCTPMDQRPQAAGQIPLVLITPKADNPADHTGFGYPGPAVQIIPFLAHLPAGCVIASIDQSMDDKHPAIEINDDVSSCQFTGCGTFHHQPVSCANERRHAGSAGRNLEHTAGGLP